MNKSILFWAVLSALTGAVTGANAQTASSSSSAQSSVDGNLQSKRYSLDLSNPSESMTLDVDMRHGNVKVVGYSGNTVEITATFSPLSSIQEDPHGRGHRPHWKPKQLVKTGVGREVEKKVRSTEGLKPVQNATLNLEIEESDNVVEIDSDAGTYQIDLLIEVPQSADVSVDLYSGEQVSVSNISGSIELETWRGDIIADKISGPIVAETHQFDIDVNFTEFADSAPSSLTTYAGDIDVTLDSDIRSRINVKNYKGEILSGLDTQFVPTETVERDRKKGKQQIVLGGQMTAELNGGGQVLSLNTFNGNVYLRKP